MLNKTDLVAPAALDETERQLHAMNPDTTIRRTNHAIGGELPWAELLSAPTHRSHGE